jgi:hypothetical protein
VGTITGSSERRGKDYLPEPWMGCMTLVVKASSQIWKSGDLSEFSAPGFQGKCGFRHDFQKVLIVYRQRRYSRSSVDT